MPLFQISADKMSVIEQQNFPKERVLQTLIESNLQAVFASRFVASEFSTGAVHAGRIDTLALSEDDNPVIIEYKKIESSELITQSLFYLSWLKDHRGDFEVAARKSLGPGVKIDWSAIRVICIAPNFRKYDLHAVQVMGADIELWSYRFFKNQTLYLEEVLQRASVSVGEPVGGTSKGGGGVSPKKPGQEKPIATYSFEEHVDKKPDAIREMAFAVQEFVMGLDPSMEEAPKKHYVAYKISKNIVCMEVQHQKVLVYLKLDPKREKGPPGKFRDVSAIGHFGTGDLEITLKSMDDVEMAKAYIRKSYEKLGG